ncbi:MAG: hypothetical protein Q9214_000947 [Letrouitia sp. 1 TL-2023]
MSLLILDRLLFSSSRKLGTIYTARRFASRAYLHTSSTWDQNVSQRRVKRLGKPQAKGHQGRSGLNPQLLDPSELLDFRQALHQASQELSQPAIFSELQACVSDLLRLARNGLAEAGDSREVARLLHNAYRQFKSLENGENFQKLNDPVKDFVEAYMQRKLPCHADVPVHILGFYKESRQFDQGIEFWNWLLHKSHGDDLDLRCFGAAIEILAFYGVSPDYCEKLYTYGLEQLGKEYASYHLCPDAILPDRSARSLDHRDTSMGLLQGILTARMLHSRWREAYLALDTAFRLRPSQIPTRFLELFIYNRPLAEAFQVFCMFCRSGNTVSGTCFTAILDGLKDCLPKENRRTRLDLLRSMTTALEAFVGAAGALDVRHLNKIIAIVAESDLSRYDLELNSSGGQDKSHGLFVELTAQIIHLFAARGVPPNIVTFNQLIMTAGRQRNDNILQAALRDVKSLKLSPTTVTGRSLLYAGGQFREPSLVQNGWAVIVASYSDLNKLIPTDSWIRFARSCSNSGIKSFPFEQLKLMKLEPPSSYIKAIELGFELADKNNTMERLSVEESNYNEVDKTATKVVCADISARLTALNKEKFRNFKEKPLDSLSIYEWPRGSDIHCERQLYDELTVDATSKGAAQNSVNLSNNSRLTRSDTGIPFDELRFLNWQSINNLLMQAEAFDRRTKVKVDEAIQDGQPVTQASDEPARQKHHGNKSRYPPSLTLYKQDVEDEKNKPMNKREWQDRILALRRFQSLPFKA